MHESKYFGSEKDLKKVSWIGRKIKFDRFKGYDYYEECLVGSDNISINEFVLVNNFDDPDNFQSAYIAEILELYDTGEKENNFCATVNWYTKPNELPKKIFDKSNFLPFELLLNTMNYTRNIELETILATTKVQKILDENVEPIVGHFLFTGREFDGHKIVVNKTIVESSSPSTKLLRSNSRRQSTGLNGKRRSIIKENKDELFHLISQSNYECLTTPKRRIKNDIDIKSDSKIRKKLSFQQTNPTDKNTLIELKPLSQNQRRSSNNQHLRSEGQVAQKVDCFGEESKKMDALVFSDDEDTTGALRMICKSSPVKYTSMKRRSVKFSDDSPLQECSYIIEESSFKQLMFNDVLDNVKGSKNTPNIMSKATKTNSNTEANTNTLRHSNKNNFHKTSFIHKNDQEQVANVKNSIQKFSSTDSNKEQLSPSIDKHTKKGICKSGDLNKVASECKKISSVTRKTTRTITRSLSLHTPKKNLRQVDKENKYSPDLLSKKSLHFSPSLNTKKKSSATPKRSVSMRTPSTAKSLTLRARTPTLYKEFNSDDSDNVYEPGKDDILSSCNESDEDGHLFKDKKIKKSSAKKNVKRPSRTASVKKISKVELTPSLPKKMSKLKVSLTDVDKIRERLHLSCIPESMPGREDEFSNIYQFIRDKILDQTGGCMYIHGVPGTGKTATVRQVIATLKDEVNSGEIYDFKFVEVNGMQVSEPKQINVQILKQLTGQKVTADHAAAILDKRFNTHDPHRDPTVLLVDELDMLWTRKQTIMYNIFDWPSKKTSKLIIVAIANTMDLPERMMMARVASRLGLTRLAFLPYNYKQLEEILSSRIKNENFFEPDAVQLVARKVAAVSGDVRRALEICRRATEMVANGDVVTVSNVNNAIQDMFAAPKLVAIRHATQIEKIFLQAVLSEMHRTGVEEAIFKNVLSQFISLCRFDGIPTISSSQAFNICSRLSSSRLLLSDSSSADLYMRIRLNISMDDAAFALKG